MMDELDAVGLARRCFEGFRDALATGDGELFARSVAEDVVFRVPVPSAEWQGEQRGRGRVRDLIRFEYDRLGLRARFVETGVIGTGPTVCIEFDIAAEARGRPYATHNCLIVKVEAGQVVGFHEYAGQMDPAALRPVMNA